MASDNIQRVRIYLDEQARWENRPLYQVLLERLQREGATSAAALRGIAGFGPGQRMGGAALTLVDNLPIIVEWIDRTDRVARTLPALQELLPNATITLEDVRIYQATLRSQGPFAADQRVSDVLQTGAQMLPPTATLAIALATMLEHRQSTLPIVNDEHHLLGVLTEQEIRQRAGLQLPLRLLPLLEPGEQAALLELVGQQPVADIMDSEPRTVYEGAALPQALTMMIEWNYEQLPVVDRMGAFAGLLGCDTVLSTAAEEASTPSKIRDADAPTMVRLVMQVLAPTIELSQALPDALHTLLSKAQGYAFVVDSDRIVCGLLSDGGVLRRLAGEERSAWLAALQRGSAPSAVDLPGWMHSVRDMMDRDIHTLAPSDTIITAARRIQEAQAERLPVVDEGGRLLGVLGRSGLLRALVQEGQ